MNDPAAKPLEGTDELIARFVSAGKPRPDWRIGVEHEKIGVLAETGDPIPYFGERSISRLLERLIERGGWTAQREDGHIIALSRGSARVTIEPGGQLELSGAPLAGGEDIRGELDAHLIELGSVSRELGLSWLGIGFRPWGRLDDIEWVPKGRYGVMRQVMPRTGKHAHDMMKRTATVQANFDWSDEDDAARKLRMSMSVTSIVTALFASSPIVEGVDTGYQSYRARVWLEVDPARCGLLPFAFEDGPLFSRYVEWALDVPLLFLYDGHYHQAHGVTFRRWMREGIDGRVPTMADWDLHLSTLFPEVRLKQYLEVRGADAGPRPMILALPALWRGLLYDDEAVRAATALTAGLTFDERVALRAAVPRSGFATRLSGGRSATVGELARELVAIARGALGRLGATADIAALTVLEDIAATERAPADRIREIFRETNGDRARIMRELVLAGTT